MQQFAINSNKTIYFGNLERRSNYRDIVAYFPPICYVLFEIDASLQVDFCFRLDGLVD